MARRVLSPDEEARLAAEAEARRDDETFWDFENPIPVVTGDTAKLAVEIPAKKLKALQQAAAGKGISLTEFVREAVLGAASNKQ